MPKRRELLIILILAVLATVGSLVRETIFIEWVAFGGGGRLYARGAPLPYYITSPVVSRFMVPLAILDLLFWFVILAAGWWVVKWIRRTGFKKQ